MQTALPKPFYEYSLEFYGFLFSSTVAGDVVCISFKL